MNDERAEMEFEPVKENWNEYVLPNGDTLRLRLALDRVENNNSDDKRHGQRFKIKMKKTLSVFSPDENRRFYYDDDAFAISDGSTELTAMNALKTNSSEDVERKKLKALISQENWNLYRVKSDRTFIRVRFEADSFYRLVGGLNDGRRPVYMVSGKTLVSMN